jgi:putative zinc finger protein
MEGSPRAPSLVGQSDKYALWDAAYVLGSLSDVDRRKFEAHLRGCPSCRQSVDELSGMPALLGHLTVDEVTAIDDGGSDTPPPRVLTSLLATVSRRRRNARLATWAVAAAAAVVTVIGVLAGVQFHSGSPASVLPRSDTSAVAMTPVAPTELTATVAMTAQGWGTQIDMNCTYPAEAGTSAPDGDEPPAKLAMVVVARDGNHERLATWMAVKGVRATPEGSTSMPIDQIAAVEIVSADTGNVLLQRTL